MQFAQIKCNQRWCVRKSGTHVYALAADWNRKMSTWFLFHANRSFHKWYTKDTRCFFAQSLLLISDLHAFVCLHIVSNSYTANHLSSDIIPSNLLLSPPTPSPPPIEQCCRNTAIMVAWTLVHSDQLNCMLGLFSIEVCMRFFYLDLFRLKLHKWTRFNSMWRTDIHTDIVMCVCTRVQNLLEEARGERDKELHRHA